KRWSDKGVRLVMLDLQMDTGTETGQELARLLVGIAEFDRATQAERGRRSAAVRQAKGKGGKGPGPKYGFKRGGEEGDRRDVRDEAERALGKRIVEWADAGWSFRQIGVHLLEQRIKDSRGRDYDTTRIRRIYHAERRMPAQEQAARKHEQVARG